MKKFNYLLFLFVIFSFVEINEVLALTNVERKEIMIEQLSDYTFDFKYVDMTENYKFLIEKNSENGRIMTIGDYKTNFLRGLVRNELERIIDLESTDAIDLFCYIEGDEYIDEEEITSTREHDGCGMGIYLDVFGKNPVSFQFEVEGNFTEVEGDSQIKNHAFSLVKDLSNNVYVADLDMLNHYVNYKSNSSSFYEGNNALLEFAKLKKIVEENPNYNLFVSFDDTRSGMSYVGNAHGSTYIENNGIIYGFADHYYYSANMFFVPVGTELEKYGEVLEKRLKGYVNDDSVKIEILPCDDNSCNFKTIDVSGLFEKILKIDFNEYYQKVGTDSNKEREKIHDDYEEDCTNCIAMHSYRLFINDNEYIIGITEMYDEKLNEFGTIVSKNNETGIILKTSAGNVPLDAKLLVETFELTKEEKDKLNSLGYTSIGAYNFQLYSIILDKVIHNFSDVTDILIPIEGNAISDKLKVIYLSDNLDKLEYFDTKVVEYEGNKYLQFSTRHFSNYAVVEYNELPPKTGDNIITYVGLFILSISVFVNLFYIMKKRLSN